MPLFPDEYRPGDPFGTVDDLGRLVLDAKSAGSLNGLLAELRRLGKVAVAAPLEHGSGAAGSHFGVSRPAVVYAKLSGSASPYPWQEAVRTPGGGSELMDGGRSGVAYEASGANGLDGRYATVRWTNAGDWRFQMARKPGSHRIDCGDAYTEVEVFDCNTLPCMFPGPPDPNYEDLVGVNLELTWGVGGLYPTCDGYGNPIGFATFSAYPIVTPVPQKYEIWYGPVSACVQHFCKHYYWESDIVPLPAPTGAPWCPAPPVWVKFLLGTAIFYGDAAGTIPLGSMQLGGFGSGNGPFISCNPFSYAWNGTSPYGTFTEA